MEYKPKDDLYSLLHEVSISMGRGPRQGLATRPGQNKVLKTLEKSDDGEMLQQELVKKLGIRSGTLSELLMKLEKEDYVQRRRSKSGGKELIVSITEKGRICVIESKFSERERDEELFGFLSKHDRDELVRILNNLLRTWKESSGESEGARRDRRWKENEKRREEEMEIELRLRKIERELSEMKKGSAQKSYK